MLKMPAWFRFLILAATMVGGAHGIVITFSLFFRSDLQGLAVFVLIACMLLAYVYVTVAGAIFWRYPNQLRPLFWALLIQVPWFSAPGLVYKFAAGFVGTISLFLKHAGDTYTTGFNTNWNLGSTAELRFFQDAPVELGINVVALAALLFLRKFRQPANKPLDEAVAQ